MSGEVELFITLGAMTAAVGMVVTGLLVSAVYGFRAMLIRHARRRVESVERAGDGRN